MKMRDINVRLPTNIHPEQYKVGSPHARLSQNPHQVHLIPFIVEDNFTIAGHVEISLNVGLGENLEFKFFKVSEPSDNITLHLHDIIVHEKDVTVQVMIRQTRFCIKWQIYYFSLSKTDTGEMLEIVGHGYDEERQFYIVHLAKVFNTISLNPKFTFKELLTRRLPHPVFCWTFSSRGTWTTSWPASTGAPTPRPAPGRKPTSPPLSSKPLTQEEPFHVSMNIIINLW